PMESTCREALISAQASKQRSDLTLRPSACRSRSSRQGPAGNRSGAIAALVLAQIERTDDATRSFFVPNIREIPDAWSATGKRLRPTRPGRGQNARTPVHALLT